LTADDRLGLAAARAVTEANQLDTHEHTLAGKLIGSVREAFTGKPESAQEAAKRAQSNDMFGRLVADTVSMLPDMHFLAAGGLRAGLLYDREGGAFDFARNFGEGMALNGVSRIAGKINGLSTAEGALAGRPLYAQALGGAAFGFGMSGVTTAFETSTWQQDGHTNLLGGLERIGKAATIGGIVGAPAGIIGGQVAHFAGNQLLERGLSDRFVRMAVGAGSGYAAGAVFGGTDALLNGGSWSDFIARANESGLIGAATGGVLGGVTPGERLAPARQIATSEKPVASAISAPPTESPAYTAAMGESGERVVAFPRIAPETAAELYSFKRQAPDLERDLSALGSYTKQQRIINELRAGMDDATPYATQDDFASAAVVARNQEVRVYRVNGTKIIIPDSYARQLEEVLELRKLANGIAPPDVGLEPWMMEKARAEFSAHPLRHDVHPVDLLPYLRNLPDPTLVRELVIRPDSNPFDPWTRKTYKPDFVTAATASEDGVMTFYKAKRFDNLGYLSEHEWSHLLQFSAKPEGGVYSDATRLEKGWNVSDYSERNDYENWAEHGQALIGARSDDFFLVKDNAPIRSSLIAHALEKSLKLVPPAQRSAYHDVLQERVDLIKSTALPRARATLEEILVNGKDPGDQAAAARVLRFLGDDNSTKLLTTIAKTATRPEVATAAFDAAWQRTFYRDAVWTGYAHVDPRINVKNQIDFLVKVAQPGSRSRDIALQHLESINEPRAQDWHQLLSMESQRSPKLQRLIEIIQHSKSPDVLDEAWRQSKIATANDADMRVLMASKAFLYSPYLRTQALDMLVGSGDPRVRTLLERVVEKQATPSLVEKAQAGLRNLDVNERLELLGKRVRGPSEQVRMEAIRELGAIDDKRAITPLLRAFGYGTASEREACLNALQNYEHQLIKYYAQQLIRTDARWQSLLKPVIEHNPARQQINDWHNREPA
jgi:HEAT repeat protein